MKLLLNTSTPYCELLLIDGDQIYDGSWEAGRELARDFLGKASDLLDAHNVSWHDLAGIGVYQGPGSFTGLRIGITVANTIADTKSLPIVGVSGEGWRDEAIRRLAQGEDDNIVMPEYGNQPNITSPRK